MRFLLREAVASRFFWRGGGAMLEFGAAFPDLRALLR